MGNLLSECIVEENCGVSEHNHPDQNEWITAHAKATGLAVVEVERLWTRFTQLGCNKDGVLESSVFSQPPANQDIFFKNVLVTFRSQNGLIAFQTFCNAMKWAETSSIETKMHAIFNMVNNGKPITKDVLIRVLKRVYPNESQSDLESVADSFIEQMDTSKSGVITLSQWSSWARRMPSDQMEALLEFNIIPPDINMEAHRAFTSQAQNSPGFDIPSDSDLNAVARKVKRYDWAVFANRLDFTQPEISQIQSRYAGDTTEQIYQMLKKWKQREGRHASKADLESTLRQCGMNDAAAQL